MDKLEIGISYESVVVTIVHEHLAMSKVLARWVHRSPSAQDRHQRPASSLELLELYEANPAN